jgi:hypothetical protein
MVLNIVDRLEMTPMLPLEPMRNSAVTWPFLILPSDPGYPCFPTTDFAHSQVRVA